ncbi:MAG: hypothetical protein V3V57_00860 [Spirochaetia bacterium]
MTVNKNLRRIRVGEPVRFNPNAPYGEERTHIKEQLEQSISSMYQDLEKQGAGSRQAMQPEKAQKVREQAA